MRTLLRSILILVLVTTALQAQTTRDFAIDLKADVSPSVPHITLSWTQRQQANITAQQIHRRLKGATTWVSQAVLTTTDTSWADTTAVPGVEYEYWMQRTYTTLSPNTALGYITAGYNLPLVENRGKLLLVVDATMEGPLGPEIEQLKRDLTGDGWTVQTISAARRDTLTDVAAAADTKALIKAAYDADPANVKQVYILGHVPVPYAGNSAWDGHGNHSGSWSADGFYGDMDGTWTDSSVNNNVPANVRLTNVPGDGRLDQSNIPSALELMVGRVDLVNMQRAPATAASETSLLRRYLKKAHDFKTKQGAYAAVQRRVLIRDGFGIFGSEGFMRTGWAWGFTGVGRPPEVTFDEAPSGNWWTHAATNTYLMANGNGGGSYETCGSVGATADFGRRPFRAAFVSLFGSYFGDWDVTNNFMRAPLAGNATGDGLGLTCFWAGRPTFVMHHMATGETVGYSIRASMNAQFTGPYQPLNFGVGGTHCGLLGDPSLRMHVVEPPRNLAAASASSAVNLSWSTSTESNLLGYHVYRAVTEAGPFTRLTASPLASPSYSDSTGTAGNSYAYMVRTLKLENSPGGTYQNLSVGEMATITVNAGASGAPPNPTSLAVVQNSGVNAQLTWQDNATDETSYRIERKVNGTGSYATLTTLGAGATSHTDTGPFANGSVYFYRVIALNGAGDSVASNEASFEAIPGFFEFGDTLAKVSKTVGTALIPVSRFGGVNGAVSVNYATSNSAAIAGTHYTAASGTLNWADGDTGTKNISVPITNTASAQMARQFRITLSTPSSGTGIGTYNAISVLIEDPTATLPGPWSQTVLGALNSSSPSVQAESSISSTTVGGSGLVTAATVEEGQFVYQARTGDGVMTAFVPAALPAASGARFAVMVRDNATATGALMAGTAVSSAAGTFPARQVSRATAGATATFGAGVGSIAAPCWLRITRAGNSFNSEASTDGSTWINQGTVTVALAATAQWGLFHTSDALSGTTYSGNFQTIGFQNVTFGAVSVPGAPGALTAGTVTASSVALTWGAATSAAGYRLERRSETGAFAQIIDLPAATLTFTDSNVGPDSAYEYRVYAYNGSGTGPLSNVLQVATLSPTITTLVTTESTLEGADATIKGSAPTANFGGETTVRVGGTSSTGALSTCSKFYLRFDLSALPASISTATLRLAVAQTGGFAQAGYSFTGSARMFPEASDVWTDSGITWDDAPLNNTTTNGFLTGTFFVGSLSIADPLSVPSPGAIVGLPLTASTINTNKGANGIVTLGMNTTTTAAWIEFASKEHATLPPPTLELTFVSTLPKRPSFLTVTPGAGSALDLGWVDNNSTETGFEIERRPAGGVFAPLVTLPANTVAYSDTTTALGTIYEYRVRTASVDGASAWSLVVAGIAGGSTGSLLTEPQTFASWMQFYSPDGGAAADPSVDTDGDGLANLIEYALGSSANHTSAENVPTPGEMKIGNDTFLTLTFARRMDTTDVALTVEVADSLNGPWTPLDPLQPENQARVQTHTPQAGFQTITVKDREPMKGSARRFMRLNASPR